jgi:hypothetical protein
MWGTFQGNVQRTGVQIPDCPTIPVINVPYCFEVIDSVKISTNDLSMKKWVVNGVVLNDKKDTSIYVKPTDKFDLQSTSIYGCSIIRSTLEYNMASILSKPIITRSINNNLCTGDSVILKIEDTTNKYLWNNLSGSIKNLSGNKLVIKMSDQITVSTSNAFGCKATSQEEKVIFNTMPETPVISRDINGMLVSSSKYGSIWYKDGQPIEDTSRSIKPISVGYYTTKAKNENCISSFSTPYFYLVTDIINLDGNQFIKVTPNPFSTNVYLHFFLIKYYNLNVDVFEINSGSIVASRKGLQTGANLNIESLSSGIYAVRVYSSDFKMTYTFKLIKL